MGFEYSIEYLKSMILAVYKRTLSKGISKKSKCLVSHVPERRNSFLNFQIWESHESPAPQKPHCCPLFVCFWGLSAVETKPTPHFLISNTKYIAYGVD